MKRCVDISSDGMTLGFINNNKWNIRYSSFRCSVVRATSHDASHRDPSHDASHRDPSHDASHRDPSHHASHRDPSHDASPSRGPSRLVLGGLLLMEQLQTAQKLLQ